MVASISVRKRHETSAPSISAAGSGRLRAASAIADRKGAELSGAAHTPRGPIPAGRSVRHHRPPVGGANEIVVGRGRHREYRRRGGSVGAAQATRARADGYTLLLGGATTHITEALLKNRPQFDPVKDLEPISGVAITAFALAVHPSVPANNLKELVAYAKANPGK